MKPKNQHSLTIKIEGLLGENGISLKTLNDTIQATRKLVKGLTADHKEPTIANLETGSAIIEVLTPDPKVKGKIGRALNPSTRKTELATWTAEDLTALLDLAMISLNAKDAYGITLTPAQHEQTKLDTQLLKDLENAIEATQVSYGIIRGLIYRMNLKSSKGIEGALEEATCGTKVSVILVDEAKRKAADMLGKTVIATGEIHRLQDGIKAIYAWDIKIDSQATGYTPQEEVTIDDLVGLYSESGITDSVAYVRSLRDA